MHGLMGIWEYKNFLIISLAVGLLSSGFVGLSEEVFADNKGMLKDVCLCSGAQVFSLL